MREVHYLKLEQSLLPPGLQLKVLQLTLMD